tara:strand:- start:471 stop:716 length:246 start_codon:yes stop_codon:yes gene_type:complete
MLSKGVLLLEALPLAEEMLLGLLNKRIAHLRKAVDAGKSLRKHIPWSQFFHQCLSKTSHSVNPVVTFPQVLHVSAGRIRNR